MAFFETTEEIAEEEEFLRENTGKLIALTGEMSNVASVMNDNEDFDDPIDPLAL